jgi:hypothetical protein
MSIQRVRKRASSKSEKAVAERLGGRRTPGSGTGLEKADGRVRGKFRIENKITAKSFYRLTFEDWLKLWTAASSAGELPVFHVKMASRILGTTEIVVIPMESAPYSAVHYRHHKATKGFALHAWRFEREGVQEDFRITGRYQDEPKVFHLIALEYSDFLNFVEHSE